MIVLFDDLELDLSRVELRRSGVRVRVERQVFEVLAYLVDHRERVVTKEELMDSVWGGRFVSESAVTSRIKQVRQAVGDDGRTQRLVRTVHGHGYRFVGTVRELARTPAPRPAPVHYAQSDDLQIAYQVTGELLPAARGGRVEGGPPPRRSEARQRLGTRAGRQGAAAAHMR